MNLGEVIYLDLHKNDYLQELYQKILSSYTSSIFTNDYLDLSSPNNIILNDLLRFADLLSKSVDKNAREKHNNIAQELISLLLTMYPNNKNVKYVAGSVLSNICNFQGLSLQTPDYESFDSLEKIYINSIKKILMIPNEKNLFYFKSQKDVLNNFDCDYFSYSGPTSMGKSFIVRSFIKNNILNQRKENYAIVVPTKALINEVSSKLINDLKESLVENDYKVITSSGALALNREHNFILVFTPERLSYLLLDKSHFKIDYLFVDEAQKISSKDGRSPFYYKLIDLIRKNNKDINIFFSSPNIPNPGVYLNLIESSVQHSVNYEAYKYTPVSQIKFLIDLNTCHGFVYNNLNEELLDIDICFEQGISNLTSLIKHVGNDKQNIVYCGSTRNAVSFAVEYADSLNVELEDVRLLSLIKEISNDIHYDYYLLDVMRKGVAYHIGYLPANIREQIEILYKAGVIKTIFCTSTLVEGVNLPADNLFITSYKNGRSNLTPVEFKNLVGRVGRIEYNLYGNVFLTIIDTKTKPEKFKELLKKEVEEQSLSIVTVLKPKYKKYIVKQLLEGNISLDKQGNKQTINEYKLMRKFAIILLKDIISDNHTYVVKQFSKYLNQVVIKQIKEAFDGKINIDDDINVSVDQMDNLVAVINNGLSYPESFDYNELMNFLNKLSEIFKWGKYENETIGKPKVLRWYAVILSQWVQGYGIGQIIKAAIKYKQSNPKDALYIDFEKTDYTDSKEHKNVVITDTLDAIEQVVLFQLSNYFLKFSIQYKKIHKVDNIKNDWYEYVEYGTNNEVTIFLQKHEISRETATYIKQHKFHYLEQVDNEWKLKNSVLNCGKSSIENELQQVKYNMPELFV